MTSIAKRPVNSGGVCLTSFAPTGHPPSEACGHRPRCFGALFFLLESQLFPGRTQNRCCLWSGQAQNHAPTPGCLFLETVCTTPGGQNEPPKTSRNCKQTQQQQLHIAWVDLFGVKCWPPIIYCSEQPRAHFLVVPLLVMNKTPKRTPTPRRKSQVSPGLGPNAKGHYRKAPFGVSRILRAT